MLKTKQINNPIIAGIINQNVPYPRHISKHTNEAKDNAANIIDKFLLIIP